MNIIKQAYSAKVLFREVQVCTVGTKYPFKDQIVLTSENTFTHPDFDLFTYTQRIDVCIRCENRIEAFKLYQQLADYFKSKKMLPLEVGVFHKPFLRDNQKARKYFAYSTITSKELLELLPTLKNDKSLVYQPSNKNNVNSSAVNIGYDLTYQIKDFKMEHLFLEEIDGKTLDTPFYKLSLYTTSIFENSDPKTKEVFEVEEIVIFEIKGESESEIIQLAKLLHKNLTDKKVFQSQGSFPRMEKDFYRVKLDETASYYINLFSKK